MRTALCVPLALLLTFFGAPTQVIAAAKTHVISFGKWTSVKCERDGQDGGDFKQGENAQVITKIRPLFVDSRIKEFVVGAPHDVTDQSFVMRRVFRFNDALPEDGNSAPRWKWQLGGWVVVDRASGHISKLPLADFEPTYSVASWYRDYVAYCGISTDAKKIYAMVEQIGRRKPILRRPLMELDRSKLDQAGCASPTWQRQPARATFAAANQKVTFVIHGSAVDPVPEREEDKDDSSDNESESE
jgi:hypothetical protein